MWNLNVADVVPGGLTDYKIQRENGNISVYIAYKGLTGKCSFIFQSPLFTSERKVVCSPGKEEL